VNGRLVEGVVAVVPQSVEKTYLVSTGNYTEIPSYGRPRVAANDLILLFIPVPANTNPLTPLGASECGWGIRYALERLHYRARLVVGANAMVYSWGTSGLGRVKLGVPLTVYVYYENSSRFIPASQPPLTMIKSLAAAFGINTSKGGWLAQLRVRLSEKARDASKYVTAVLEARRGWLVSKDLRSIVDEAVEGRLTVSGLVASTELRYIDGGGGGLGKFYWFALILNVDPNTANRVEWSLSKPLTRDIYLGSYVKSIGLHVLARAPPSSASCVKASITVYRADNGVVIDSQTHAYELQPGQEAVINVYPSTYYGSTPLKASVEISSCSPSPAIVELASLEFTKSFTVMPIEFTRQGFKLLSYGIASSKYWAESRLDYAQGGGLKYPSTFTSITLGYGGFNGIYLDYDDYTDNAYLMVDVVVENNAGTTKTGYLRVKVNGYTVAEQYVVVGAHSYRVAQFNIPLRSILDYQEWGGGGILTIENTFNDDKVVLYVDAFIRYQYLPEVWSPQSLGSWCTLRSPALKAEANFPRSESLTYGIVAVPFKATIVASITCIGQGPPLNMPIKVKIFKSSNYNDGIGAVTLRLKIPAEITDILGPEAGYKTDEKYGQGLDEYLGYAITLHYLVSTGLSVVSLFIAVPGWAAGTVFVTGIALEIVKASLGGGTARYVGTEFINGEQYYVFEYHWSPGLSKPTRLEIIVRKGVSPRVAPKNYKLFLTIEYVEKSTWRLSDIPVVVSVKQLGTFQGEPFGFYGRTDVGYS
jgi:hypothetical protein